MTRGSISGTSRRGTKKTVIDGGMSAAYLPSGHIVYAKAGKLLAVPFDVQRREVTGTPFEVQDGVMMSRNTGAAHYALSKRGDLAYVPGTAEGGRRTLVWVDRNGKAEPLPLPPASYLYPRISPDQKRLAVEIEGPNHDFYFYDFARTVLSKVTTDGLSHDPVWSPDGLRLAFRSWQAGGMTMWWMQSDRSGKSPTARSRRDAAEPGLVFSGWEVSRVRSEESRDARGRLGAAARRRYEAAPDCRPDQVRRGLDEVFAGRALGRVLVGRIRQTGDLRAGLSRPWPEGAGFERRWHRSGVAPIRR